MSQQYSDRDAGLEREALAAATKSDGMRTLLRAGYSVALISRVMSADYAFVYGVAKRANLVEFAAKRRGFSGVSTVSVRSPVRRPEPQTVVRKPILGHGTRIEIRRIGRGPSLVIEDAEQLVVDFFDTDPSSAPGGYDDLAGRTDANRITRADIVAINTSMRARSPHRVWEALIGTTDLQPWLSAVDGAWGLVELDEDLWQSKAIVAVEQAITATVAAGRGLSVATKVLHLKRPRMFPVLDRLVLEQLGVTDSVKPMAIMTHLRDQGRRNETSLRKVQENIAPRYERSLVRILDVLLWVSHPAAGLSPALGSWSHVMRRET